MEFSTPNNNEVNEENKEELTPKKYVFKIYPENIEFIEKIDLENRNAIINHIISKYTYSLNEEKKLQDNENNIKKLLIRILAVIIGIPLILVLINFSLKITMLNYKEMQHNFRQLYESKGKY